MCPSLFFQFNMRIRVIYDTLSVSCKRVVSVLSPLAQLLEVLGQNTAQECSKYT